MGCRSVNVLINMQKMVSLNYFWRRNLPNFKFNCIVLRTCPQMPMHRNWTGVLSTHFHFEMAEGCPPSVKTIFTTHFSPFINKFSQPKSILIHWKKLIVYLFKRWHYDAIIIDVYFCLTPPSPTSTNVYFLETLPSPLIDDVFYECRLDRLILIQICVKNTLIN